MQFHCMKQMCHLHNLMHIRTHSAIPNFVRQQTQSDQIHESSFYFAIKLTYESQYPEDVVKY